MPTIAELAAQALEEKRAREAAAVEQARDDLVAAVRAVVGGRLSPLDAAALSVEHVDLGARMVVLGDGHVCLTGRESGRVDLVTGAGAEWTLVAGPLASLAHLGEVLAERAAG